MSARDISIITQGIFCYKLSGLFFVTKNKLAPPKSTYKSLICKAFSYLLAAKKRLFCFVFSPNKHRTDDTFPGFCL